MDVAEKAYDTLRRLASKRVASEQHMLRDYLRRELSEPRWDRFLVPEEFSLGYHTPYWEVLSEGERLALNHWVYALMYTRISDGEEYVCHANRVLSEFVRPHDPQVADLVAREAAEEVDHIAAFQTVKDLVREHHGVGHVRYPKKPGRKVLVSDGAVKALLRGFGVDFVVAYFLARGVANHMGMGFERPLSLHAEGDPALARLSHLHTQDESQHLAVSRLLAAAARRFLPAARSGPLYRRAVRTLLRTTVHYTFSETISKPLEQRMSHLVVPQLTALEGRAPGFLRELVDAHFASVSGIERSRNRTLGPQNRRLLADAALEPADKVMWAETILRNQQNLRFLDVEPGAFAA